MTNFGIALQRYGEKIGKHEGNLGGKTELILSIMRKQGWDAETTMDFIGVDSEERPVLAASVEQAIAKQEAQTMV